MPIVAYENCVCYDEIKNTICLPLTREVAKIFDF